MKRFFGICIIVLFLVAICVGEELFVSNTVKKVKQESLFLYDLANSSQNIDTPQIQNATISLSEFWKKREHSLCFFINYKDMSELSNEIIRMVSYSKNNIKEEYTTSLLLVLYYCETFDHITGFNMQNIF